MHLLLVEDDPHLAPSLAAALRAQYQFRCVGTLQEARASLAKAADLYIIDIGLPDGSGLELIRQIRADNASVPILMLTAEHGTDAKVKSLDSGADDYLTKPFSMRELLARLRALIRRSGQGQVLVCGDLRLDRAARTLVAADHELRLSKRMFVLLEWFMRHPRIVQSYDQLNKQLWDADVLPASNALAVYIGRLRQTLRLMTGADFIHTVSGIGYVLDPDRKESYGRAYDRGSGKSGGAGKG